MVPLDTGWNWTPYFVSKTTPSTVSGYVAALHPVQDHVAHRDLAQQGFPPGSLRDDPGQPVQVLRRVAGRGGLGLVSGQPSGSLHLVPGQLETGGLCQHLQGQGDPPIPDLYPVLHIQALPLTST